MDASEAVITPLAWLLVRPLQLDLSSRAGECGSCGYARAGLQQRTTCPECGHDSRVVDMSLRPVLRGSFDSILVFALGAGVTTALTCSLAIGVGLSPIRPLVSGLVLASLMMPIPLMGVLQGRSGAERGRVIAAAWLAALVFITCFISVTRWDPNRDAEGMAGVALHR